MSEDLKQVFLDILEIDSIAETDSVQTVPSWDSVHHLSLVMAIEERFGVTFDAEEIPELTSVAAISEALERRQGAAAG
jgi:acyl carrier protein